MRNNIWLILTLYLQERAIDFGEMQAARNGILPQPLPFSDIQPERVRMRFRVVSFYVMLNSLRERCRSRGFEWNNKLR